MNITFRQMRLFLALADTGSVGAAARALHVTQPTASMQLREITSAVGLPLYEVISRKVHLTDAGRALALAARDIAQRWESFEQLVSGTQGLTRGKLRVAVVSTAKYFMPRLVGAFCHDYPDIDASLEILNRDGVVQRLRENRDDLYVMSMPPSDIGLHDDVIMPNPLVLIAPSEHPLARRRSVVQADLASQRFILRERGSGTRMAVDRHFRRRRFRPDIRLELGSNEAVKEAVAGGLGIGVISRHSLHGLRQEHGVRIVDVDGFPIDSNWHLVHQSGKQLSPIAAAFRQYILGNAPRRKTLPPTPVRRRAVKR